MSFSSGGDWGWRCQDSPLMPTSLPSENRPSNYDSLSSLARQMYDLSERTEQSYSTSTQKLELRSKLKPILESHFQEEIELYIVGSSVTGLCVDKSDVDMSLITSDLNMDQSYEAISKLTQIRRKLSLEPGFIRTHQIIKARVSLLRFETYSNLKVDLTLGNSSSIRSTYLVSCYVRLDPRVRPLIVAVKLWAKKYSINDAYSGGLSSYSLTLMVICYLQFACKPAVLPCLQALRPHSFNKELKAKDITLTEPPIDCPSGNTQTVDELLIGFFRYYSREITLRENVISVRTGSLIRKLSFAFQSSVYSACPKRWQYVCIEEPFDGGNTAASIFWLAHYSKIINAMTDAHKKLVETRDLYSILRDVT